MPRGNSDAETPVNGNASDADEPIRFDGSDATASDHSNGSASPAAFTFTDPASAGNVGNSEPGEPARRGRGRPRKNTGDPTTQAKHPVGVEGVANILMLIHTGLSAIIPEMELSEKEATSLARASTDVMAQYNIKQTRKAIAWTGLISVCATIYGPRLFAIRGRQIAEKREKKPRPSNVVHGPFSVQPNNPLQ